MDRDADSRLLQRYGGLLERLAAAPNLQQIRSGHNAIQQLHADVSAAAQAVSCTDVAGHQLLDMLVAAQYNCLLLLSQQPPSSWGSEALPRSTLDAVCTASSAVVALMSLMRCPDKDSRQDHVMRALMERGKSYTTQTGLSGTKRFLWPWCMVITVHTSFDPAGKAMSFGRRLQCYLCCCITRPKWPC
jgi:hypothetical protein